MSDSGSWKWFMTRHWGAVIVFAIAAVLTVAGAVYVFWWFVQLAQSSSIVPATLGLWSMGNLITFMLYAIFWELLLVGIPVIIGAAVAWLWWRRLPSEERMAYHWGRGSRRSGTGGGFGFLLFIFFAIKVWLDGNWNLPIAAYSLNYVVGSIIEIFALLAAILGIPGVILAIWWVRREMRKP